MRSFGLAVALLTIACHPAVEGGVPLYPGAATTRLPRDQIAQVSGPIGVIDGKDVAGQGNVFELLPGCHVVELDPRTPPDGFAMSGGMYWSGQFPPTTYALRTLRGASYLIERQLHAGESGTGRVVLSAREVLPNGVVRDVLPPVKSSDDVEACKAWEASGKPR